MAAAASGTRQSTKSAVIFGFVICDMGRRPPAVDDDARTILLHLRRRGGRRPTTTSQRRVAFAKDDANSFENRHSDRHAPGGTKSAICVQRFDDSRNSAIHTTYRSWLRSSSMHEPRDPPLKVVSSFTLVFARCQTITCS